MRITFISGMSGYPWGGSEMLWSEAAIRLSEMGHEVQASVVRWPVTPRSVMYLKHRGVHVLERGRRRQGLIKRFLNNAKIRLGILPELNQDCWNILAFKPDLVCVSHGATSCGIEWMQRCMHLGIPYVSVAQANFEQWWPDDQRALAIRTAYEGARKAFFVSHANLALFEKQLGISLNNAEVIWNPFNVRWNACPPWPESVETVCLACVGRLEPGAKGQDLLFQVLALPKWRERPVTLTLFGNGPWEKNLRLLAEMLGITDRVTFAGHVEDIEKVWSTHHVLVLPSRYEGLPLSMVEAMLCGRPVIVTDVAGNSEPLEDNITGYIAESPSVRHLDEAMERAWHHRYEWRSIGAAAGLSIRKQIPQDPAQVFIEKLLTLC
jgi:glycosyltransferase involved in cell wall biosynthesis